MDFTQLGLNFLMGFLGITLYLAFKAREFLNSNFSITKLWYDNKWPAIWANFLVLLVAFIISIEPEAATAIKTILGLDVANSTMSFLTLGVGLIGLATNITVVNTKRSNISNNDGVGKPKSNDGL